MEKRLFWLCRRGMKELDLMCLDYFQNDYPNASPEQKSAFETLLNFQDPYIVDLLFERIKDDDAEIMKLIDYLRNKSLNK